MKVAADFRREAREALQGKWMTAVLAGLAASILGAAGKSSFKFNVERTVDSAHLNVEYLGMDIYSTGISHADLSGMDAFLAGLMSYILLIAIVLAVIQFIVGCIVAVGYAKFNLNLMDGEESRVGILFDYFPQWKTMVKAGLLQALYVFLWTLLLVIPGIIAGFRYAMTNYILAENPELTASEAINRSKELMDGNKWRLFCLGFSFIGWDILCGFTLGIGYLWLQPYQQAANAAFYRDITRPLAEDEQGFYLQETILN